MDTQHINEYTTDSVTGSTKPRMSKEELQQKQDQELLILVERAKGHTGNDFGEYMNCNFSYTYLTTVLKDRGYENGWHKTLETPSALVQPTIIKMKKYQGRLT